MEYHIGCVKNLLVASLPFTYRYLFSGCDNKSYRVKFCCSALRFMHEYAMFQKIVFPVGPVPLVREHDGVDPYKPFPEQVHRDWNSPGINHY